MEANHSHRAACLPHSHRLFMNFSEGYYLVLSAPSKVPHQKNRLHITERNTFTIIFSTKFHTHPIILTKLLPIITYLSTYINILCISAFFFFFSLQRISINAYKLTTSWLSFMGSAPMTNTELGWDIRTSDLNMLFCVFLP